MDAFEENVESSLASLQEQLEDLMVRMEAVSEALDQTLLSLVPLRRRGTPCGYCGVPGCGIHCVYCLVDYIEDDEVEHGPGCPTVTGLWPTDIPGACCCVCGDVLGDTHALIPEGDSGATFQAVCLTCKFNEGATDGAA